MPQLGVFFLDDPSMRGFFVGVPLKLIKKGHPQKKTLTFANEFRSRNRLTIVADLNPHQILMSTIGSPIGIHTHVLSFVKGPLVKGSCKRGTSIVVQGGASIGPGVWGIGRRVPFLGANYAPPFGSGSKNRYQNGTRVSGDMDQNMRNPSCLPVSHTPF